MLDLDGVDIDGGDRLPCYPLDRFAFPPISLELRHRFSLGDLFLRPFAQSAGDQDIDFRLPRPHMETSILACCTQDGNGNTPNHPFFWNLEIGKRTECLLTLATQGGNWDLTVELRCPNPNCEEAMDLDFSLAELTSIQRQAESKERVELQVGSQIVSLRRPTGLDQLTWRSHSFPNEATAVWTMMQSLILTEQREMMQQIWESEPSAIATLNQSMMQNDPLVNANLTVNCPTCNTPHLHSVDLGALALQRLHQLQAYLLETLHRLASHYHWTEATILALPQWRRDRYLALIERERQG